MNDVVERVARKLCAQHGGDPDALASEPHDCWSGPLWTVFVPDARAVIEAMREPTIKQLNAAVDATGAGAGMSWVNRSPQKLFAEAWSAMLSAALADASPDIGKEGIGK